MELNAKNVHDTFLDCLFKDGENTNNHIVGEGVMNKVGFHPERLESHKNDIIEMCEGLPNEFKEKGGGGMSFLNMCNDKNGTQWADLHQTMDELVALGNAIGKMAFLMPREMWGVLPCGMPYLVVKGALTKKEE